MELLGVIGNPISHSLSPLMHNTAFKKIKKQALYVPMLVDSKQLTDAIYGARALGFTGINVTVPYKEQVLANLTDLSEEAKAIKSVNTILFKENSIIGHSTDGAGFIQAVNHDLKYDLAQKKVLVAGAGGAARAIVYHLLRHGCHIYVANRTNERAKKLVSEFDSRDSRLTVIDISDSEIDRIIPMVDVVVNTTPVGMSTAKDQVPLSTQKLTDKHTVIDIIYNPIETQLLKLAKAKGCRTQNGLGMLVWQAALAWEFWWGISPPLDIMYETVKTAVKDK